MGKVVIVLMCLFLATVVYAEEDAVKREVDQSNKTALQVQVIKLTSQLQYIQDEFHLDMENYIKKRSELITQIRSLNGRLSAPAE